MKFWNNTYRYLPIILVWMMGSIVGLILAIISLYIIGSIVDTITEVSTERAACQKRAERPTDYHRC